MCTSRNMAKNRKSTQNRWTYTKGFTAFLPYIWPTEIQLQLRFPLIATCLVANRVVNVLLPITLGQSINDLGQSRAHVKLSWRTASTYILLRYLDCPAGLNLYRHCVWLPVKKRMHMKLSCAAYAHVMSQSSDFHDSKQSGKLFETIRWGNSITKLFEFLTPDFLPMTADLILALGVFWWIFDIYMVAIIAYVAILFFWSMQRTQLLETSR